MPPRKKASTKVVAAGIAGKNNTPPLRQDGGNSVPDQEWILAMLEDGTLRSVSKEDAPKDYYWDVMYQWDGESEEINPEFFEFFRLPSKIQPPPKCNGVAYIRDKRGGYIVDNEWNRLTRQCLRRPLRGGAVCEAHGAKIPAVKAAAARRLAEASEIVAMRLVRLTATHDEDNNPIEHKDRISASNSVLDRAGIKGNVEVEITVPGYKKVLETMFGETGSDDDAP